MAVNSSARAWRLLTTSHRSAALLARNTQTGLWRWQRLYTNRNLLRLRDRGLIQTVFPEQCDTIEEFLSKPQTVYAGFDPTADSLHIGNLLVVMVLLHSQRGGHNVLALIGGATALLGDPSGKTVEREILERSTAEENAAKIESCLRRIFENHNKYFWKDAQAKSPLNPLRIVNNMNWYLKRNVIDFLASTGRNFRMGTMLLKKSVQTRLNSPEGMSFAEFSYQMFQAYDWLHLYDEYKCMFQVGGSDQMGNIHAGHDLISKSGSKCYGFMVPLVTSESGNKLGKSAGNAIWLSSDKTTPFEFYQIFMRLPDDEVEKYLKLFTFLSLGEIEQLMESHWKSPDKWIAQKKLAEQLTLLVHGESGLQLAKRASDILFHGNPEALALLTREELFQVFEQATSINMVLEAGTTVLKMVMQARCFASEHDCRRISSAGGLHINYKKAEHPDNVLIPGVHILPNGCSVVRVGKRNYYIVKFI